MKYPFDDDWFGLKKSVFYLKVVSLNKSGFLKLKKLLYYFLFFFWLIDSKSFLEGRILLSM